jgi:hypothetical protein
VNPGKTEDINRKGKATELLEKKIQEGISLYPRNMEGLLQ